MRYCIGGRERRSEASKAAMSLVWTRLGAEAKDELIALRLQEAFDAVWRGVDASRYQSKGCEQDLVQRLDEVTRCRACTDDKDIAG